MTLNELSARQHGLLMVAQVTTFGVTRAQMRTLLRRGVWRMVDGRVLAVTSEPTTEYGRVRERALAALLRVPGAKVYGRTAAALMRWDRAVVLPGDELVHVYLPRERRRTAPTGVRIHQGPPISETIVVDDVPCLPLTHVLDGLAIELPFAEALVVAESAFLAEPELRHMTRALPEARGLSESALEALALALWHLSGLPLPVQQATVRHGGRFLARVDFLWPAAMLVVEVDGMGKYTAPGALGDEKVRQNRLVNEGYVVLRFTWADVVGRPNAVLAQVARHLQAPYTEVVEDWVRNGMQTRPVPRAG